MFLGEPHTVARSYKTIRSKLGDEIFRKNHQLMPYYVAAFALYKLEYLFRSRKDSGRYKVANCTQAQPVFYGFAGLPDGKVILVSVLRLNPSTSQRGIIFSTQCDC